MAEFAPEKKVKNDFNNGQEYRDFVDALQADTVNNLVKSQLWTQKLAENPIDNTEADNVGIASLEISEMSDGTPRLKAKNIKGDTGNVALAYSGNIEREYSPSQDEKFSLPAELFNRVPVENDITTILYRDTVENISYNVAVQFTGEVVGTDLYACYPVSWVKISGEEMIMKEDLTLAGNYIQVGNISKGSETATITYPAKGKTVTALLQEIFSKRLQPQITQMPSVSGFALSSPNQVEAGTRVQSFSYGTAVLNPGSYTYGPATGVVAQSYRIDRICQPTSMSQETVGSSASGIDDNNGDGFILGDVGGTNVVSSIQYKATINYGEGVIALDNMGGESDPIVRIPAGNATQSTIAVTPYRNYFYGTTAGSSPPSGTSITSAFVRGLTKSNRTYAATTFTLNVPAGATGIYIACIASRVGVTKVINETALNADVTNTFVKQVDVPVEGANGYSAILYNVWHYIPAVPYENAAVLKVTLG